MRHLTFTFPKGGSIAYTELLLELFLADKPKLNTKKLRNEYRSDIKKLRRIRDQIKAGRMRKKIRAVYHCNQPDSQRPTCQDQRAKYLDQ